MTNYANLKINMLFDPAQVWQHTSQFEKSFADYLNSIGLQGETVKTIGGSSGELFFLIRKQDLIPIPQQKDKPQDTKSPQQKLKEMSNKPEKKK